MVGSSSSAHIPDNVSSKNFRLVGKSLVEACLCVCKSCLAELLTVNLTCKFGVKTLIMYHCIIDVQIIFAIRPNVVIVVLITSGNVSGIRSSFTIFSLLGVPVVLSIFYCFLHRKFLTTTILQNLCRIIFVLRQFSYSMSKNPHPKRHFPLFYETRIAILLIAPNKCHAIKQ